MANLISPSYVYNCECPVCGNVYKSNEMKKRWDGLWVCEEDWEPRHPSDFYRPKNDAHKLPFTLPEQDASAYTPSFVNRTDAAGSGAITSTGSYRTDPLNGKTNFSVQIAVTVNATTATASATVSLPTTAGGSGTVRVLDIDGVFLGTGTISGGGTTATLPDWAARNKTINIHGQYTT